MATNNDMPRTPGACGFSRVASFGWWCKKGYAWCGPATCQSVTRRLTEEAQREADARNVKEVSPC